MTNQEKVLNKLRDIGKEMIYEFNCRQGTNEKQYMVAYLVSENELKTGNSCIEQLQKIQKQFRYMVQNRTINLRERGYIFGRFVFFMNLYDKNTSFSYEHTEKRFFDPYDILLQSEDRRRFRNKYLTSMLDSLRNARGNEYLNHRLLICTYYIPCTNSQHQCAKLIKRFAEGTGCKMTIGWITSYKSTYEEESIKEMSCENIIIKKLDDSVLNSVSTFPNELCGGLQWEPWQIMPPHIGASWNGQQDSLQQRLWSDMPCYPGYSWSGQHDGSQRRPGPYSVLSIRGAFPNRLYDYRQQ